MFCDSGHKRTLRGKHHHKLWHLAWRKWMHLECRESGTVDVTILSIKNAQRSKRNAHSISVIEFANSKVALTYRSNCRRMFRFKMSVKVSVCQCPVLCTQDTSFYMGRSLFTTQLARNSWIWLKWCYLLLIQFLCYLLVTSLHFRSLKYYLLIYLQDTPGSQRKKYWYVKLIHLNETITNNPRNQGNYIQQK